MRERPIPGSKYFAGTILSMDGRMGKHVAVRFKCAHCVHGVGRTRFSYLKAGLGKRYQTKSCGCKKKACSERFHRTRASRVSLTKIRKIFVIYSTESAPIAAGLHGISTYQANFCWQRWCRRLEALPETHHQQVYEACQRSWQRALATLGYNAAELRWICRHWRLGADLRAAAGSIREAEQAARRDEALRVFTLFAPLGSLTGSLYDDACLYIDKALASAKRKDFRVRHYRRELTRRELALVRRSDYAWIYEMLRLMQSHEVITCFGQEGIDFLALCRWTFACRRSRRENYLRDRGRRDAVQVNRLPPSSYGPVRLLASTVWRTSRACRAHRRAPTGTACCLRAASRGEGPAVAREASHRAGSPVTSGSS
jgi:hypothetical protein